MTRDYGPDEDDEMTLPARRLPRRRTARSRLAMALPLAVTMSLILATAVGASAAAVSGTTRVMALPPMSLGASGPDVTVEPAGRTYVSSSSTARPQLFLTGWTDLAGRPLDAKDNPFTHAFPVEIRLIDEQGNYQAASVYPEFTDGAAELALALWPFTRAMEPHTGTYRIQWRASAEDGWSTADTIELDVRLPEPSSSSSLEVIDGTLFGRAWTFDQTSVIGGSFRVALTMTPQTGSQRTIYPLATFQGTYFCISPGALVAAGAPSAGGYSLSAVVPASGQTVSVEVPPAEIPAPDPGPAPEPPAPDPGPEPTVPADGVDSLTPLTTSTPRPPDDAQPPPETAPAHEEQEEEAEGRPEGEPAPPVQDASGLDASNAGSLSGTRRGDLVTLILPSTKAKEGDWVAVFIFPGATTNGWVQVGADHSVSVDVSGLGAGTYQIAIANRDSELLGWAQLEISEAGTDTGEGTSLLTIGTDPKGRHDAGTSDWMLLTAGGLLALGAGAGLLLIRPASGAHKR